LVIDPQAAENVLTAENPPKKKSAEPDISRIFTKKLAAKKFGQALFSNILQHLAFLHTL